MRLPLPTRAPLFELLFAVAKRMNQTGQTLRIIGGLAMHCWHREMKSLPRVTEDIDCAFPSEDWPSKREAEASILGLLAILDDLGLERPSGPKAKASRTARFTYARPGEPSKIELICGSLSFGSASRRKPAWRLLKLESGQVIYASRLDWLEIIPEWVEVEFLVDDDRATVLIPSLAGLLLLKLKAVTDKLGRCDEEQDLARHAHELERLERHGGDLLVLFEWALATGGTFPSYKAAKAANPAVRQSTEYLQERVLGAPPSQHLERMLADLREIAPAL
ncbi:MAG: nucleotidyl transferase AbiEii/AbiGii toxin family protein [Planctomycetes bacterium]|nr:nucleotidyl transferase AbiEii/AbiGii toxin family protein [Planctomycetota bacterium]